PLADPYLLGAAAGAGLGATIAIIGTRALDTVSAAGGTPLAVPVAAFAGALLAVGLAHGLGARCGRGPAPPRLILTGGAVANFLTAGQSFIMLRYADTIKLVFSWIMGRLTVAGWHDVLLLLPYVVVAGAVIVANGRQLDVLSVGDEEARSLGAHPVRTRYL